MDRDRSGSGCNHCGSCDSDSGIPQKKTEIVPEDEQTAEASGASETEKNEESRQKKQKARKEKMVKILDAYENYQV